MKKLLSVKELSEKLGIAVETIYVWTSMKQIPYYKVGRLVRFNEDEIEQWLEKRKQQVCKYAGEYWKK